MPPPPPPPPPPPQPPQSRRGRQNFVIISLPPPDDPSKGKTITTFTLSDESPPAAPAPELQRHSAPTLRRPRRKLRKVAAGIAAIALVAASLWACLFSEIPLQLLGGIAEQEHKRRNETHSFVLPIYPKTRGRVLREVGDVKLAGKIVRDGPDRSSKEADTTGVERNTSTVMPIKGNIFPDGQYYTTIFVGNPPRPYYLDVDTGSSLTWIQCDAPCTSCAKGPHPLYKPTNGKIVLPRDSLCGAVQDDQNSCATCKQCDYKIDYADQSSSMGVLARDDVHLMSANGQEQKINFVFGCGYDQQGHLLASPAKTDGILGLSTSKISLPTQLANQGIISNVFGHCISKSASGGGYLFLGADYVPRWGMTWVPTRSDLSNLYYTEVEKVTYGDQQLSTRKQVEKSTQLIFDSGSSYTYFPNALYINLISSFYDISTHLVRDTTDDTLPMCWKHNFPVSSVSDVKHLFKPLTLHFGKRWFVMRTTFTIPPEGYLVLTEKGNVCLGILDGKQVLRGSTILLGDVSLRGNLVVYDNEKKEIGWLQSDCTAPQKNNGFPFFL